LSVLLESSYLKLNWNTTEAIWIGSKHGSGEEYSLIKMILFRAIQVN
jgi:hypothetical protein